MKITDYICEACGGEFKTTNSQESLDAERNVLFPGEPVNMVCEPCFIKIMDYCEPGQYRYLPFIMDKNFKCDCCSGEFLSDKPDEDVLSEFKETFPNEKPGQHVCTDCYIKVLDFIKTGKLHPSLKRINIENENNV